MRHASTNETRAGTISWLLHGSGVKRLCKSCLAIPQSPSTRQLQPTIAKCRDEGRFLSLECNTCKWQKGFHTCTKSNHRCNALKQTMQKVWIPGILGDHFEDPYKRVQFVTRMLANCQNDSIQCTHQMLILNHLCLLNHHGLQTVLSGRESGRKCRMMKRDGTLFLLVLRNLSMAIAA